MERMDSSLVYSSFPLFVDFLTDQTLIEKYAKQQDISPSVPQVIDLLLRQASLENSNEPYLRLMRCHRVDVDERSFLTTRRNRAAKTVSLMLGSAINWDLDKIEKDMSITMQFCLLQDLMNTTFTGTDYCSSIREPGNVSDRLLASFSPSVLQSLGDHALFGLFMYARWILRAQIERKIPKRSARGGIVSIGSITDPDVLQGLDQQPQFSLIWTLFRQISREKVSQTAVSLLGDIVGLDRSKLRVPVVSSFVICDTAAKLEEPNWPIGLVVPYAEVRIQIFYDLARYWLFEGKIVQTTELLQSALSGLREYPPETLSYFKINIPTLLNMCNIVGLETASLFPTTHFPQELTPSLKGRLAEILVDDLTLGNVSSAVRKSLELEIELSEDASEKAILQKVRLCNLLREYIAGNIVPSCMQLKNLLVDAIPSDVDWFRGVVSGERVSTELRNSIYDQLQFLVQRELLSAAVKPRVVEMLQDHKVPPMNSAKKTDDIEMVSVENAVHLGMSTFRSLKLCVEQLPATSPHFAAHREDFLSATPTKVPPNLKTSFSATLWSSSVHDLIFLTFARATELTEQGCFRGARQLLKQLRSELSNVPQKLEKNFRWQNMYADLVEILQLIPTPGFTAEMKFEAVKRAKACITATFFKPPDEEPVPGYVQNVAVMVLFNLEEWDFITEMISTQDQKRKSSSPRSLSTVFPFLKQLIQACHEFQGGREDLIIQSRGGQTKHALVQRQHCMKLWNVLSAILSTADTSQPIKKGAVAPKTPVTGMITRDTLWSFTRMIRNKTAAYLLLSCFCRMWTVINRDTSSIPLITEILWPDKIPLHCTVIPSDVGLAISYTLEIVQASGLDDAEVMIIKGDYYFGLGNHRTALKMYLLSAVPDSFPGFLHPASSPHFSQVVLRKMATCFEAMRCYTNLAVLCQLMQPVDHTTAFRVIAEKVTYDAGDEMYQFIWDPLILEHAAFVFQKYGFLEKRQVVIDQLQNPILAAANPPNVVANVIAEKTGEFFEVLFDQYAVE